jgi:hypothetical protein
MVDLEYIEKAFFERYKDLYWVFCKHVVVDDLDETKKKRKNFFIKILGKDYNRIYKKLEHWDKTYWDHMFEKIWQQYWPIQYPRWYTHDRNGWNNIRDALYELCLLFWVDPLKVMVKEKRW